jgi:hypothetical protein
MGVYLHSGGWGRCKGGIRRRHIAAGFRSIAAIKGFITQIEQVALGLGPPVKVGGGIFDCPAASFGLTIGEFPVGGCAGRRGGHLAALGQEWRRVWLKAVPPPAPLNPQPHQPDIPWPLALRYGQGRRRRLTHGLGSIGLRVGLVSVNQ